MTRLPLLALRRDLQTQTSSLRPTDGLPHLTDTAVPQQGRAMKHRQRLLEISQRLRNTAVFSSLSVAEGAVLATLMERREIEAGMTLTHDSESSAELLFIDTGWARIRATNRTGQPVEYKMRGPGTCVGANPFPFGLERLTEIIALTPITLLALPWDARVRYLGQILTSSGPWTTSASRER